jgi:hypothetical protein
MFAAGRAPGPRDRAIHASERAKAAASAIEDKAPRSSFAAQAWTLASEVTRWTRRCMSARTPDLAAHDAQQAEQYAEVVEKMLADMEGKAA